MNKILGTVLCVVIVSSFAVAPLKVSANTVSVSNAAQIQVLLQLLTTLRAMLAELQRGNAGTSVGTGVIQNDDSTPVSTGVGSSCTYTSNSDGQPNNVGFNNQSKTAGGCEASCIGVRDAKWGLSDSGICTFTGANGVGQSIMTIDQGTQVSGSIKNDPLYTYSENPTIYGTASGLATVGFSIDDGGKVYGSGQFDVVDGKWSHKIRTDLDPGRYGIRLYDSRSNELDRGSLKIFWYPKIYDFAVKYYDGSDREFVWESTNTEVCGVYKRATNGGLETIVYPLETSGRTTVQIISPEESNPEYVLQCSGEDTRDGKDAPVVEKSIFLKG